MTTAHVTDQVARALDRLPAQHHGKTKTEALLTTLVTPFQAIEDALWDLFTLRSIANGIGAQLDMLGKLVGQARAGRTDTDYRRFLRARIKVNKSRGTAEDILAVSQLVLDLTDGVSATFVLQNSGIAAALLQVLDVTIADSLAQLLMIYFLRKTSAAGVRMLFESSAFPGGAHAAVFDVDHFDTATAVFAAAFE